MLGLATKNVLLMFAGICDIAPIAWSVMPVEDKASIEGIRTYSVEFAV